MTFSESIKEVLESVRSNRDERINHDLQRSKIPAEVELIMKDITEELTSKGCNFHAGQSADNVWYITLEEFSFEFRCADIQKRFDVNPKLDIRRDVEETFKLALQAQCISL